MPIIWLLTLKKVGFQNLQLTFLVILQIFDLECHHQTSAIAELVMFALVFMNFRKLRSLISIKLRYFHYLSHSLFYWALQLDKSCFQKIDLYKLNLVPRGTRLIDINYLKLYNTLLQTWCIRCYAQFVSLYEIWKSIRYSLL